MCFAAVQCTLLGSTMNWLRVFTAKLISGLVFYSRVHQLSLWSMKLLPIGDHGCWHRFAISHLKSLQNIYNISSLPQENMSIFLSNLHPQLIMHQSKVCHLELWSKILLARINQVLSPSNEQIINIQQKNKWNTTNHNVVQVGICFTLLKPNRKQVRIDPGQSRVACFRPYNAFFSL